MAEGVEIGDGNRAANRLDRLAAFIASPAAMISMALLAVALFAMPYYLRTAERQLFEGQLMLSLCGGLTEPISPRRQARAPLL